MEDIIASRENGLRVRGEANAKTPEPTKQPVEVYRGLLEIIAAVSAQDVLKAFSALEGNVELARVKDYLVVILDKGHPLYPKDLADFERCASILAEFKFGRLPEDECRQWLVLGAEAGPAESPARSSLAVNPKKILGDLLEDIRKNLIQVDLCLLADVTHFQSVRPEQLDLQINIIRAMYKANPQLIGPEQIQCLEQVAVGRRISSHKGSDGHSKPYYSSREGAIETLAHVLSVNTQVAEKYAGPIIEDYQKSNGTELRSKAPIISALVVTTPNRVAASFTKFLNNPEFLPALDDPLACPLPCLEILQKISRHCPEQARKLFNATIELFKISHPYGYQEDLNEVRRTEARFASMSEDRAHHELHYGNYHGRATESFNKRFEDCTLAVFSGAVNTLAVMRAANLNVIEESTDLFLACCNASHLQFASATACAVPEIKS